LALSLAALFTAVYLVIGRNRAEFSPATNYLRSVAVTTIPSRHSARDSLGDGYFQRWPNGAHLLTKRNRRLCKTANCCLPIEPMTLRFVSSMDAGAAGWQGRRAMRLIAESSFCHHGVA
jgi:hypothetical protein